MASRRPEGPSSRPKRAQRAFPGGPREVRMCFCPAVFNLLGVLPFSSFHDVRKRPKRPPREPQDDRGDPWEGSKTAKEAPKTCQEGPKTAPRRAQEGPKKGPRGPTGASITASQQAKTRRPKRVP
eukprot:3986304-Pyramimonas_sp.AAC.1